ncbi:hypothetical protein ASG67_13075 [Sphingomonas sp. Leaf339]|uniref:Dyp-type peroxidase n=1 Tax=Sphingomonas sp. Leaf339 TaxID=1736343 RepID=UPI0006F6A2E6|nr:hypothetical protein [Sphingomonas sp. Leaf339]KQU48246.1 hypothetical protein ASG67_13075 [Sphingomonas sp. Leaf339]
MAIDLTHALEWTSANSEQLKMLEDLQGNILDGHGRKSTRHLFLKFDDPKKGRAFVRDLNNHITSARAQLQAAKAFRHGGPSAPPFVAFMLSSAGYAALQLSKRPSDGGAFDQGMLARRTILNDPAPAALEEPYRQRIDAMILIGGNPDSRRSWGSTEVRTAEKAIRQLMGRRARVVAAETGRAIFRDNGTDESGIHKIEGIEHFGYVDGRSQPLMLKELVRREADESDGISVWNPEFPIGQVLVPDPGSPHRGTAFGSYFVFRKLEQNVAAFKKRIEEELADETGLGELAGAMLVGRFEDGTPVVSQRDPGGDNPVMNNFDYAADPDGLRCPLHAHIRKTNPRGDVRRQFGLPNDHEERSHIMARRGMTYGRRNRVTDPSNEPPGGVGLMFMAYHRDLATGFEFTQQSWANAAGFVAAGTGRDPIIGQRGTAAAVPLQIPGKWGVRDTPTTPATFEEFVSHRGGEYFFAPAKSTLAAMPV